MHTSHHLPGKRPATAGQPAPARRLALAAGAVLALTVLVAGVGTLALGQGRAEENAAFTGQAVANGRQAADRANIVQSVDALFAQFDAEHWSAVGELLADRIDVDFSSLGGPRARLTRDELVGGWRSAFAGPKSSGHSTTNHQVRIDGDQAEVFAHGYAYN